MRFCTECGTPTAAQTQKFCTKCGANLAVAGPGPDAGTALTVIPPGIVEPQAGAGGATGSDWAAPADPPTTATPFGPAAPEEADPPTAAMPSGPAAPEEADPPTAAMPSGSAAPEEADPPTAMPFGSAAPEEADPPTAAVPWSATPVPYDETSQDSPFPFFDEAATSTPADETVQQAPANPWSRDAPEAPSYTPPGGTGRPLTPSPWSREATQAPSYSPGSQYLPQAQYGPGSQYSQGSQYTSVPPDGPVYPPAQSRPPAPPPQNRSGMWIAAVVVAVLLIGGGGGFAAWKFVLHKSPSSGSAAPRDQTGGSPTQGTTPTSAATPTPTTPPATPTPGVTGIALSPSAQQQPDAATVSQFVATYFAAINAHSYAKYTALLDASQVPVPSRGQFRAGFGSTTDSAEKITSIANTGNSVAAGVRFTSHQSPSASPTSTGCDVWHITLFLEPNGSSYLIGPQAAGYHAQYRAC